MWCPKDNNIYLTYQNDGKTDPNCLIRFKPDGTGGEFPVGQSKDLCDGTPHGLKIATEDGVEYLYHANNNQKLTKTTLDGTIVWQRLGNFGQDASLAYRPTWFAVPPASKYIYLCDGCAPAASASRTAPPAPGLTCPLRRVPQTAPTMSTSSTGPTARG